MIAQRIARAFDDDVRTYPRWFRIFVYGSLVYMLAVAEWALGWALIAGAYELSK